MVQNLYGLQKLSCSLNHFLHCRTGTFSPFAGNIAFVLYRYIHDEEVPLKIAILVNGHYIKLPRFEGCYLCDYDIVRQHFESILDAVHCATVCGNSIVHDEL